MYHGISMSTQVGFRSVVKGFQVGTEIVNYLFILFVTGKIFIIINNFVTYQWLQIARAIMFSVQWNRMYTLHQIGYNKTQNNNCNDG